MKKVEVSLRDAFGKSYEMDVLPRPEIERILEELTPSEIIQKGIDVHNGEYGATTVSLDMETGKLTAACHSCGSGPIRGAELVELFSIGQYSIRDCDDSCDYEATVEGYCTEEEHEKYKAARAEEDEDGYETDHDEACEKAGINWNSVKEEIFYDQCVENWEHCEDSLHLPVEDQLDGIYEKPEQFDPDYDYGIG